MKEVQQPRITRRELFDNGLVTAVSVAPYVIIAALVAHQAKLNSESKDFNSDENGKPYGQSYNVPPDITGVDRVLVSALGTAGLPALRAELIVHSRQKKKISTTSK